eukprot:4398894-Prorocentrum_lima.AAC.1
MHRDGKTHLSFTMLRNPVFRALSAFYYRCHNPNEDCYRVREDFCQYAQRPACKRRNFTDYDFQGYLGLQ